MPENITCQIPYFLEIKTSAYVSTRRANSRDVPTVMAFSLCFFWTVSILILKGSNFTQIGEPRAY